MHAMAFDSVTSTYSGVVSCSGCVQIVKQNTQQVHLQRTPETTRHLNSIVCHSVSREPILIF